MYIVKHKNDAQVWGENKNKKYNKGTIWPLIS